MNAATSPHLVSTGYVVAGCSCPHCEGVRATERRRRDGERPLRHLPHDFSFTVLVRAMKVRTLSDAARLLGISVKHAQRLQAEGLTLYKADEYAVRAKLHPANVWGDQWLGWRR